MVVRRFAVVLLGLAVLASAMAVIYATHENRKYFVELQALENQRDEMEIDWGRLQLEQGEQSGKLVVFANSWVAIAREQWTALRVAKL